MTYGLTGFYLESKINYSTPNTLPIKCKTAASRFLLERKFKEKRFDTINNSSNKGFV